MKKTVTILSLVLVTLLLLCACGREAADFSTAEALDKIKESVTMPAETVELGVNDLLDYYGIAAEGIEEVSAVQDACGYKDEIVILKAADEKTAEDAAAHLEDHIGYQRESMKNYDPEMYDILTQSEVIRQGKYAAMFISREQDAMEDIFESFVK